MRERDETAYNLVLQINEIKPEQWGPWDEQDYRRIDAALRRAKAEVWREAARLSRMRAHDHALAISRADDVLHRGVEFAKQIEAERIAEAFDARAAQIEEGE